MDEIERRLNRAKFHLDDLDAQVKEFKSLDPFTAVSEPDARRGGYAITITEHLAVPATLGLVAADFVNNLRALLDNLVWTLASSNVSEADAFLFH